MTTALRLRTLFAVTILLLLARQTVSIYFNGSTYIQTIKPLDLTKKFTLSFRTCSGGRLLHQIGNNGLHFELVVVPGTVDNKTHKFTESSLALSWQTMESKNLTVINVGTELDQNKPYDVVFTPRTAIQNRTLAISLGNVVSSVDVPSSFDSVGGENLTLGQGFVGCVTFGEMFDLENGTSDVCPLENRTRCSPKNCSDGFKGYYCEINIDECASIPCHHASTCIDGIANYTCTCGAGWKGRNCDQLKNKTLCDDNPCLKNGICQLVSNFNNYTCACPVPFTGRNCNETADPCGSMPCKNNATNCTNIKHVDFQCDCLPGFAGKQCEIDIDDCASADCGHGKCVDGIGDHNCNCTGSGYNGRDCKEDIDECLLPDTCFNNGTCKNYAGGFLCTCLEDYRGKTCEEKIDDCAPKPCKNGGKCTDLVRDFSCQCGAGYSGRTCEVELHDCNVNVTYTACDSAPCKHGNCNSTCTASSMYYNCTCEYGYTGVNCDQDINECANDSICGDNGTCTNTNGSFWCKCSDGFAGRFCNETEGPCNPSPCENGLCHRINITVNSTIDNSNSSDIKESYNCSCHTGWRGRNCTEDVNECDENIDTCNKTTSTCENTVGSYQCQCKPGYEGKECKDINECKSSPCENGGVCKNFDGSFQCFCALGFTNPLCGENINDCIHSLNGSKKCVHGGCKDGVTKFTCVCDIGWTGILCDQDIDECSLGYCVNKITCENTPGNYNCTCQPGYTDRNCSTDIDDCATSLLPRCKNNGTCRDMVNDYECDCPRGYEGKSCEIDIDWCNVTRNNGSIPCDYGICVDDKLNYTCSCFDGFSGRKCSIDKNECADMPCNNSGICVQKSNATAVEEYFGADRVYAKNESGGYLCKCQPGYNGTNCQNNINECTLYRACNDTGTKLCTDGINNYTCNCKSGFEGRNCSEDIDECLSSPCQNNGTCQNLVARYNCLCDSNHTGVNCESLVDPCTALTPCRNGATCHVNSNNYTCACAEGYAGKVCTDTTTLGFDGTSSMTLPAPQSSSNILFSFQTIFPEGVLVSQSSSWTLSLVSGKLKLKCVMDSCEIENSGMFNDFNWHQVGVFFDGSTVSANVSSNGCMLPCGLSRTRRSVTADSRLVVGADAAEDSEQMKFVGSIRDFSVNNVTYYPGINGVNATGIDQGYQRQNVCSPDPCVNGACKDLWTRYSCECDRYWTSTNCTEPVLWGTFGVINQLNNGYIATSNESYASYTLLTNFENLEFTVRTKSAPSLIIQLKSSTSRFLSVETDSNGYLQLRDKNGDINSPISGFKKINDGISHYVNVTPGGIEVDNKYYTVTLTSLQISTVFVGGLPETGDDLTAHAQFRGCIRDVRVNGQQLLFFNQTAAGLNSTQVNVAKNCSGENVCASITGSPPCSGRGNCTDLWNERNCTCQYPYGGVDCKLYGCEWTNPCPGNGTCVNLRDSSEYECINEVTFNDSHSSAHFTNSTPLSTINNLTAQFRTRQNNTVILSSVHNATFFEITVQDGRIMVGYNLSENMSGVVDTGLFISDGDWHQVTIESLESQTNFKLSTMKQQRDKFTFLDNHSLVSNVSLLSHPLTTLLSLGGVRIGSSPINSTRDYLFGCLREVRLGKYLLPFTENAAENGTADSSPNFSLVKSAFVSSVLTNVRLGCHRNILCTSSVCGNGTCIEGWNTFHCTCPEGYHGDRCEFNTCTPSPCVTGTCTVGDSGFECTCADKYVGVFCNETCTSNYCQNGGNCGISSGKLTCTCEADWTGQLCESAIPRDDDDDDDDLPLIIGLAVAGGVLVLLVIAVIFVCTRQTSSTFGTYSPRSEEKVGARVEMNPVLNVPPPEKLI